MRDYHEAPRLTSDGPERRVTFRELWAFVLVVVAGTVAGYVWSAWTSFRRSPTHFPGTATSNRRRSLVALWSSSCRELRRRGPTAMRRASHSRRTPR